MMDFEMTATQSSTGSPIDIVEEIAAGNDWAHERSSRDELYAEVAGRWARYRLFFYWDDDVDALQFACHLDIKVTEGRQGDVTQLLEIVNERLWLGHFDVDRVERIPMFRYTLLLRGAPGASVEQVEDLIDISLSECERFYPAFQFVVWGGKSAADAADAAIIDPIAEA